MNKPKFNNAMKRILFFFLFFSYVIATYSQSLFVASYNIRYQNSDDSIAGNAWGKRCPVICDMINFESPDIFGSQEVLNSPLHDMLSLLPDYSYIGVGRDDGKLAGEYSPIFYKRDKFDLLNSGTFWLSPTPLAVGSKGWDAALPRICTWGNFRDKETKLNFWFFNLHMDHIGVVARRESAKLVLATIKRMCKDAPVILTGDFNVDQNDEIYSILINSGILKDSYVEAKYRFAENGTFNSFMVDKKTDSRIDHVFVSSQFHVQRYGILTYTYWNSSADSSHPIKGKDSPQFINLYKHSQHLPSDHYPVMVHLGL
jgi:endonuclease/exonuclease/phosphatase family metal-dependent hydrolase